VSSSMRKRTQKQAHKSNTFTPEQIHMHTQTHTHTHTHIIC
jgi:hypothetical protein